MVKCASLTLVALCLGAEGARVRRQSANSSMSWSGVLLPGKIDVKRPAFLFKDEQEKRVLISQFGKASKPTTWNPNPFPAKSAISEISLSSLKSQVGARQLSGSVDYGLFVPDSVNLMWPNKLSRSPYGDYIVVPDGFLPPTKEDGNVYLARPDGSVHSITTSKDNTFYHEVEWIDFNGDGVKDILTSSCTKGGSVFSGFEFSGQLWWLENPGVDKMDKQVWTEHMITEGPDVIFKSMPYKGGYAVFTTEFFVHRRISIQFLYKNGTKYRSRTIDDNLGKPFAISMEDLDGDGVKELLVTNHQGPDDEILPGVYAYEIDWSNLETGAITRHVLSYGLTACKTTDPGVGSPGFAHSFYPEVSGGSGPKYIYAAGDGSFDVWILKPTGRGRFDYETQIIDLPGTTGEILIDDLDGDGIQDLLVPDNDFWGLHVITFTK